jgi:hypothetical protein
LILPLQSHQVGDKAVVIRDMRTMEEREPQIILAFQNYAPPFDAEKTIRRMLRIVLSSTWGDCTPW